MGSSPENENNDMNISDEEMQISDWPKEESFLQLMPPPPPPPPSVDPLVNPHIFTDPSTVMTEAPPNIENIPILQLPEIPPEYAQAMAIHARGLSGKFKMEYELEWKYFGEELARRQADAIRIYNEEVEKYTKAQNEDQERKKRLGNLLKKASGKSLLPVDNKEVKNTAEQLQTEIRAKRDRLREEEEKRKSAALKEVEKYVEPVTGKEEEDYRSRRRYSPDRSSRDRYRYHYKKREYENDRYRKGDDDTDIWRFNPKHRNDSRKVETSREYRHKEESRSRSRSAERKMKY